MHSVLRNLARLLRHEDLATASPRSWVSCRCTFALTLDSPELAEEFFPGCGNVPLLRAALMSWKCLTHNLLPFQVRST